MSFFLLCLLFSSRLTFDKTNFDVFCFSIRHFFFVCLVGVQRVKTIYKYIYSETILSHSHIYIELENSNETKTEKNALSIFTVLWKLMAKQMRLFPSDFFVALVFASSICLFLLSILSGEAHFYRIKIDDTFSINLFTVLFYYFNSTIFKSNRERQRKNKRHSTLTSFVTDT